MSVSVAVHKISGAESNHVGPEYTPEPFDRVTVKTEDGDIKLFLPRGTGISVADAINCAVAPAGGSSK